MARAQTSLRNSGRWVTAFATAALLALAPHAVSAAKFRVLHSFGASDGATPMAGLVSDSAGNLYGTTTLGGEYDDGTIFELRHQESGKYKARVLYSFRGSMPPRGGLVLDAHSNLYGTAAAQATPGGYIFELSPGGGKNGKRWSLKQLYTFTCQQEGCPNGSGPVGGLTYAGAASGSLYDGASPLYGATEAGGANSQGVVYQFVTDGGVWQQTVLYSFCSQGGSACTDGKIPEGGLIVDPSGTLFGTTLKGGTTAIGNGGGVAYALTSQGSSWSETTLYRFCSLKHCSDGYAPMGDLTRDSAGNLYGVTLSGGRQCPIFVEGCGVVFRIVPSGENSQESVVYAFCKRQDCKDGLSPGAGLLLDADGNFMGTTLYGGGNDVDFHGWGGGTAFKLSGSSLSVLHAFCSQANCTDGELPESTLLMDGVGNAYGNTQEGGAYGGGTTFRVISD